MEDTLSRKTADRVYIVSLLVLGVGLTVFGLLLEIKSVRIFTDVKESQSWPATQGIVISSSMEMYGSSDKPSYKPRIIYRYMVNGTYYSGEKISLDAPVRHDYYYASQVVKQYPVGKSVLVYYKPEHPERALLELSDGPLVTLFAVIFFLIAGLFILIYGIMEYHRVAYHQSESPKDDKG